MLHLAALLVVGLNSELDLVEFSFGPLWLRLLLSSLACALPLHVPLLSGARFLTSG